jgi:phage shock protein PspC (stress-responsive transcriptional regulator)
MNATHEQAAGTDPHVTDSDARRDGELPLRRPIDGRMLAGVAAGIGRSLGVDPVIVRLAFVVLALAGGAGIPLYLAGWLLIPEEVTGRSLAAVLFQSATGH